MKSRITRFFGGKNESTTAGTERTEITQTKSEWIFVDKGNYLMRSLPFSL
ncbi:MAG: hypothetical protein ACHQF2_10100 [Flavobacteriales bacterium]